MNICIFEDDKYNNFYPLSLSRPVYQLHCGIYTLAEKIKLSYPKAQYFYHCRQYLQSSLKKQGFKVINSTRLFKSCLFINGRLIADSKLLNKLTGTKTDAIYYYNNELIAAYLSGENLRLVNLNKDSLILEKNKLKKVKTKTQFMTYIWDFVHYNTKEITNDAKYKHQLGMIKGKVYPGANLIEKNNIYLGRGSKIKPGAVIDAENGPVIIEKNTEVMSNAVIMGPVYIGPNCKIKAGAKIYEGTSAGQFSKVGGEVEESIIHEYSNKQHEGFLGHAYIGSWCNLGADTNNSDLKNNYSSIVIILNGKKIDTGSTFVGLFMGDHSKTGINTMFNTGTVVGFCSNVFGAGYLPKSIPSFSWFDAQKGNQTYKIEKAMSVAKKVMARRKVKFSAIDKNIFNEIFNQTKTEKK